MATDTVTPIELPQAPKTTPLRITDDEQAYLVSLTKIATDTNATMVASQEYVNAKAAADALNEHRTALKAKYGLGPGDAVNPDGTIKRGALQQPGQQRPGFPRPVGQ